MHRLAALARGLRPRSPNAPFSDFFSLVLNYGRVRQSIYAGGSTPLAGNVTHMNSALRQRMPKTCPAQGIQAHGETLRSAKASST